MEKTAFVLFVLSLIISPLLFGGVHAWVYTLVFLLILTGNLLLIKSHILQSDKKPAGIDAYTFRWPKTGMLALFSLFVIYLILQMIPLPDSLLLMLSPEAKAIGNHSLPAIGATDPGSLKGQWFPLAP